MVPSSSAGISSAFLGAIRLRSCGMSRSPILMNYGGESCPLVYTPGSSTFTSGSISGISISFPSSSASNTGIYTSTSLELSPTPVIFYVSNEATLPICEGKKFGLVAS